MLVPNFHESSMTLVAFLKIPPFQCPVSVEIMCLEEESNLKMGSPTGVSSLSTEDTLFLLASMIDLTRQSLRSHGFLFSEDSDLISLSGTASSSFWVPSVGDGPEAFPSIPSPNAREPSKPMTLPGTDIIRPYCPIEPGDPSKVLLSSLGDVEYTRLLPFLDRILESLLNLLRSNSGELKFRLLYQENYAFLVHVHSSVIRFCKRLNNTGRTTSLQSLLLLASFLLVNESDSANLRWMSRTAFYSVHRRSSYGYTLVRTQLSDNYQTAQFCRVLMRESRLLSLDEAEAAGMLVNTGHVHPEFEDFYSYDSPHFGSYLSDGLYLDPSPPGNTKSVDVSSGTYIRRDTPRDLPLIIPPSMFVKL